MSSVEGDASGPRHLLPLDGVRGIAVLVVIVHNSSWISGASETLSTKIFSALAAGGWVGVQLFFVLSGFLITGILLDARGRPRYFSSFYARRSLRIFPLYYTFLATTVFIAPLFAWSPEWVASVSAYQWPYWFYLSNWTPLVTTSILGITHFWSLAVEEQFYLVWPLVVWAMSLRSLRRLTIALLVLTPFVRLGMRLGGLPASTAYTFTVARWDALAAGALLVILLRDAETRQTLERWLGTAMVGAGVALVALTGVVRGFGSEEIAIQVAGQSLATILSAGLIAYAVAAGPSAKRWLQRGLSAPVLRTLGKYSYAMYVFHFPIHQLLSPLAEDVVRGTDTNWRLVRLVLYLVTVIALTFLAALVSWRLIEKPFLDLKERLAPRPS